MEKDKTALFIEKAIVIHGSKYDYSTVKYIKNSLDVTILCPKHGPFKQRASGHLTGRGCAICSYEAKANTEEVFRVKAEKVHSHKYNYTNLNFTLLGPWITPICPLHGSFKVSKKNHLAGHACPTCGNRTKPEDFLKRATEVHGDTYDYSLCNYEHTDKKVTVICKYHGPFEVNPTHHLNGHHCRDCANEQKTSYWTFLDRCRRDSNFASKPGHLYVLSLTTYDGEEFLKIGVSSRYIGRLANYKKQFAKVDEIYLYADTNQKVGNIENSVLKRSRSDLLKYVPKFVFDGFTECVSATKKSELIKILEEEIQNGRP